MAYVSYIKYPLTRLARRRILNGQLKKLLWVAGQVVILMVAVPVALLASVLLGVLEELLAPLKSLKKR